jgi:hypothetical protein
MDEPFDALHMWLGIPPKEQPPNHYHLLGLSLFETDSSVIEAAAFQRITYIQKVAIGEYAAYSHQVLSALLNARQSLLDPNAKRAYDDALIALKLAPQEVFPAPHMPSSSVLASSTSKPGALIPLTPVLVRSASTPAWQIARQKSRGADKSELVTIVLSAMVGLVVGYLVAYCILGYDLLGLLPELK